jgi:hypothetical protein
MIQEPDIRCELAKSKCGNASADWYIERNVSQVKSEYVATNPQHIFIFSKCKLLRGVVLHIYIIVNHSSLIAPRVPFEFYSILFSQASLLELTILCTIRALMFGVSQWGSDAYFHSNCAAILLNVASSIEFIGHYAAER